MSERCHVKSPGSYQIESYDKTPSPEDLRFYMEFHDKILPFEDLCFTL